MPTRNKLTIIPLKTLEAVIQIGYILPSCVFRLLMNWRNGMLQDVIPVEQEWARALARFVANQLPQAVSQVSDIQLNSDQIAVLQRAFENTLVTNMGCEVTTP
jgi:hypothetical protein